MSGKGAMGLMGAMSAATVCALLDGTDVDEVAFAVAPYADDSPRHDTARPEGVGDTETEAGYPA
jgi:hypothetical protein